METGWMTRLEAAEYLRVSMRTLDRLGLPRTILGRSPRYAREVLDQHMHNGSFTPPKRSKGGLRPPLFSPSIAALSGEEHIKQMRARLRPRRKRRPSRG
jgi:hypothetical protein